jgi:hypothetical protein
MNDRARVEQLLGRPPRGPFDVVVRDDTGDPVVVRNSPFLDDGTPMPTRYYLVGSELVTAVSRLEAAGGVKAAEAAIPADEIASLHRRYAAERDAAIGPGHDGPRPSGGVGGTREGVKCLHAHVAHHLATGNDPVGAWALARLDTAVVTATSPPSTDLRPGTLLVVPGDHDTTLEVAGGECWTLPIGPVGLLDTIFTGGDPPRAEDLSNALGLVSDHLEDVLMDAPALVSTPEVRAGGPHVEMLARVELGLDTVHPGSVVRRADIEEVFRTIVSENDADRAANPGLDPTHVRSIVGSCCLVLGIMRRLQAHELTVEQAGAHTGSVV